jgi:2-C-methyl-D-erythritol 4-phosphate cytidylyltransferase/2-C-methyl-D-erythritol 2,4-cyclodiphosphate synthase
MTEDVWGAVIVAAGSGSRFGGDVPKQFRLLRGRPVLDWSIESFLNEPGIRSVVVVLPPDDGWRKWWIPNPGVLTTTGGDRRQDSVINGITELGNVTHVLVHDGARPLVSSALIRRVMESSTETGAIPVLPVRDTVRRIPDDGMSPGETVSREDLWLTQTPQGFVKDLLLEVLESSDSVTDEASAMEEAGYRITPVPGDLDNVKLTVPDDMRILESIASKDNSRDSRIGFGIDFHPFRDDRPLIVAGCRLAEEGGLLGHSDGDVVLHAIADGILSAARIGDIGTLFPPGDERWKDADSGELLRRVAGMAIEEGFSVKQVDVTLVGERPKVSFHRIPMIQRIAAILEIEPEAVWVKGTTTNTLGDIGRGRGLACSALIVLERM